MPVACRVDGGIVSCHKMKKKKQNQFLLRNVKNAFNVRQFYGIQEYRDNFGTLRLDIVQKSF